MTVVGASNSSRIVVLDNPAALPGHCAICGSADKNYYVDFRLNFEFFGVLYFCDECVAETARVCGFNTPEDAAALMEKISEATAENILLKQKLRAAEAYIRESLSVDPDSVLSINSDSISSEPDSLDEEGVGEEGQQDSESTEFVDEQRSDDLRDTPKPITTSELSL